MRRITINGKRQEVALSVNEVTGDMLRERAFRYGDSKKKGRYKCNYMHVPMSFDIETTTIYDKKDDGTVDSSKNPPYAYMYHWQMCIDDIVVFGRTWKEFQSMIGKVARELDTSSENRCIIWVHNLSFEFQFFRRFVNVVDGFYRDTYKPIYVVLDNGIEFRCSYMLTGLSLADFTRKHECFYRKQGDFDYRKKRTSQTPMTDSELEYCYCDVRGLTEAIQKHVTDNYSVLPLTKTGFVRRDFRNSMRGNKKNRKNFLDTALTADMYKALRMAFRGGDTHANYLYSGKEVSDVESWDIKSSYPACMVYDRYPIGAFSDWDLQSIDLMEENYAYLVNARFTEISYKADDNVPYIALAKVTADNPCNDNGRVISADSIEGWFTDVDLRIIMDSYVYKDCAVIKCYASVYGYLPHEFTMQVRQYFRNKTQLDGLDDDFSKRIYLESKERLNSSYGMTVTRIDNPKVCYDGGEYSVEIPELDTVLEEHYHNRNNFLPYQWGVWITANARRRLREGMRISGRNHVYNDTDSVKCIESTDIDDAFGELNRRIYAEAKEHDMIFQKRNGKEAVCGSWEKESTYVRFKTLGAKKYIYELPDGKIQSVIAGVSVARGSEYFKEHGLEAFKVGTVVPKSGHLTAFINDDEVHEIEVDGVKMETASNVALVDGNYTIGVTEEYMDLMRMTENGVIQNG